MHTKGPTHFHPNLPLHLLEQTIETMVVSSFQNILDI